MKIQQLRYFVAVYELGSFSAGAAQVNATQSGLSMHVRQLENRYGVKLFDRNSMGVEPTEAGRRFYEKAIAVLNASSSAEDVLKELSGSLSDHIHVGLMPAFTRGVLSPTLLRFSREFEHVRLSIQEAYSSALSEDVANGKLDFAVVPAFAPDLNLNAKPMGTDQECLVVSADNPLPLGDQVSLGDLPPLKLVLPSSQNSRRPRIEQYLSINGIKVAETMELDAMLGTLDLVANSDWASILPSVLSGPDLNGKRRKFTPITKPSLTVEYVRITRKSRPLSHAAQAFADILQEELNDALEMNPLNAHQFDEL